MLVPIILLFAGLSRVGVEVALSIEIQAGIKTFVAPQRAMVQGQVGPEAPRNDVIFIAGQAAPEPGETFRDCPDCTEMVVVPSGEFDMGSRDAPFESPPHHVTISRPFAIARRETTFSEWDACVADGACKYKPDDHGWGRGNQPLIDVSWEDAKVFVVWLTRKTGRTYRLPSEAEWEYSARAGTTSKFWWGNDVGKSKANCDGCGDTPLRKPMPAGSFRPNGFGLYDTSGNAYEWVEDCWNDTYANAPQDGSAWKTGQCSQRVLRGGSFANKIDAATSAARFRYDVDVRYYANGFRVVRDIQ
jgi:formylglycine-generating enzyme required for sulfatase activity